MNQLKDETGCNTRLKWTLWQYNDRYTRLVKSKEIPEPVKNSNCVLDTTPTTLDPNLNVNDTKGLVYHGKMRKETDDQRTTD